LDLIRDRGAGAEQVKFADMNDKELANRIWTFPEAMQEYVKRFVAKNVSGQNSGAK
jgi:hypothetical protein